MTDISVADLEARSGVEKEPGETLAEYLRRLGDRTDLPDEDVEAVITEIQRRQFAGETTPADDAGAPIGAFLEAIDTRDGADGGESGADGQDSADTDPTADESDGTEDATDETAAPVGAAAGTGAESEAPDENGDGQADPEAEDADDDPLAFYRSVAVIGIIILLGAGVLGSALLLGTDLGSDGEDPGLPTGIDDLEEAANDVNDEEAVDANETDEADDSGDGTADGEGADGTDGNDSEPGGADTEGDEDGADDPDADDETTGSEGDAEETEDNANDTDADGAPEEDDDDESDPIGFNEGDNDENNTEDDADADGEGDTGVDEATNETETDADDEGGADETDAESEDGTDNSEVVDSAPEATSALEVTDRAASGDHPADEYIELTNVGEDDLDISGWTVRDREGGAVDVHGIEPLEIPEGYELGPGESLRIVTGAGENTAETVYWGQERQLWRTAGDVVIVFDADGEEVLRQPYGDQA